MTSSTPPPTPTGLNPCCGLLPLRTATKTIAIFQVVFSILAVVTFIVASVPNIGKPPPVPSGTEPPPTLPVDTWSRSFPPPPPPPTSGDGSGIVKKSQDSDSFPMWINLLLVVSVVMLSFLLLMASINLFKGARDKVQAKCRLWMGINIFLFLVMGVVFGFLIFHGVGFILLGCILGAQILHGYFIFVVNAFINQI